jgi:high-affinity nickel-transport protein
MVATTSTAGRPLTGADRTQLRALAAAVVGLHLLGWGGVWWCAGPAHPTLVGLAGLAYAFGLRHAFDADHIAAIDNTTRKLMRDDARPLGVGLFFSLGHSTVVFLLTLAIALAARALTSELPRLHEVGQYLGTTVSGLFLYLIGFVNVLVMIDIYRVFRQMQCGAYDVAALETRLLQRGLVSRWFGWLFRVVTRPWHMYLVGFLFGLGFDTATEIALLTTAGVAASQALPLVAVLSLPVVFAAGMSLMDTADGVLMCGAYGWALANPLRKVFYNLTVTGLSVVMALFVGTIELLSIVGDRLLHLHGGVWELTRRLDFQAIGYSVVGLFVVSWLVSLAVWKVGRFDERWTNVGQ